MSQISRRSLLSGAAGFAAAAQTTATRPVICAFSKHFHWTDVPETAKLCAEIGFGGVDLTVRRGGHVAPERVAEDLPKAAEAIHKAGLKFPMITTEIMDPRTPHAEAIIKTMASLGIRRYRWGGFRYDEKSSIPEQLAAIQPRVKDLAALNRHYGVCAMYHTHSGIGQVGASQWDLYLLIKDADTESVGVNYDIGHATVEGGLGGWVHSARLQMPYLKGVAVKDFKWEKNARGVWVPGWCALGDGMVHFKQYFRMLKAAGFSGPLQLHYEYPELGGADNGKTSFSIPKERLIAIFRRDLDRLHTMLREGDWM